MEIVCHRGANEFAPENTYASAQVCIDWGMDFVEIDVNTSADGVLYLFHGPGLEKTTNGRGVIMEQPAAVIDRLDAGSWFDPRFAGERVPRLDEFLRWIKGQAKLFLDVKWCDLSRGDLSRGDLAQLVALIRQTGFEQDCFFWFKLPELAAEFRQLAPDWQLKVNAATRVEVETAVAQFQPTIIETGYPINPEVAAACREHGLKLMVNYMGDDEAIFAGIIGQQPEMVNVNFGDRLARVLRRNAIC
jgi:glycerophosphoryl diester phosphodiesterase